MPIASQTSRFSSFPLNLSSGSSDYLDALQRLLRTMVSLGWRPFNKEQPALLDFWLAAGVASQFDIRGLSCDSQRYASLAAAVEDDTGAAVRLSPYMVLIVRLEHWIEKSWDLADPPQLSRFIQWLFHRSRFDRFAQCEPVRDELTAWAKSAHGGVNVLAYLLWSGRSDLQLAYDLNSAQGCHGLMAWCSANAIADFELSPSLSACFQQQGFLRQIVQKLRVPRSLPGFDSDTSGTAHGGGYSSGVCVVGSFGGEFGVGQHARSVVASLDASGDLKCTLLNAVMGPHDYSNQTYSARYAQCNDEKINLQCVNIMSALDGMKSVGARNVLGRYNICYGYWELAAIPEQWTPFVDLFDEFWAPTKFIADALSAATRQPVLHMPIAIEVVPPQRIDRQQFQLPSDKFLFLFHFDAYSFAERKNPQAAIQAFKHAFPSGQESAALIIKTKYLPESLAAELQSLSAGDRRIIFLSGDFSREQIIALEACCDAYISLHRAEGFGMGPAEMMCLGKPVIVTNYSGNTDFTLAENSCLVDYELVAVRPGQYAFYEPGQQWAEPDVEQAAHYMRKLVQDQAFGAEIGRAARQYMHRSHNANLIGARYLTRLKQIADMLRR